MLFQLTTLAQQLHSRFLTAGHQRLWFHADDFRVAVAYTLGLIVHPAKAPLFQVIRQATATHVAVLSDFLNPQVLGWPQEVLFDTLIQALPPGGELITDLFVVPKDNTTCMQTTKVYSSCLKRVVAGQAFVLLAWTLGTRMVVIGCRQLEKPGDCASVTLALIERTLQLGLRVRQLLADGDYCRLPMIKALRQLKLILVSKVRRDMSWYVGNVPWKLTQWASQVDISQCHYYPGYGYAKGVVIACHGCAPCKFVLVRPKRRSPRANWLYLLSTDPDATVAEILRARGRRWRIEVAIRDTSQHLGLKRHQGHLETSQGHVLMCFLAYNELSEHKARHGKTIGHWRRQWAKAYEQERTSLSAQQASLTSLREPMWLTS